MSSKKLHSHSRREYWQSVIEHWKLSNLSGKRFCDEQGLALPTFYKWRQRLNFNDIQEKSEDTNFLEVSLASSRWADVEIKLISGSIIHISNSANGDLLNRVFTALRESGLC